MMQEADQQDDVPLDVRLANLILKNGAKAQGESLAASSMQPSSANASPHSLGESSQSNPPIKPRQRRPNQAQRRQMSSQVTIPIDHRHLQSQDDRSHDNFVGHRYHQSLNNRNQRPQSAAYQTANLTNGLARGGANHHHSRHLPSPSYPGVSSSPGLYDWRQPAAAQNCFPAGHGAGRPNQAGRISIGQARSSYNQQPYPFRPENLEAQVALLEQLGADIVANAEIDFGQIQEKENFRLLIEDACRVHITQHENVANGRSDFLPFSVQLRCFGSLASGFATKSSDMDLGLLSPMSLPQPDAPGSPIPRIVEKTLLDMGFGARLLSKTRVPIIKVCEKPSQKLFSDLLDERARWDRGGDEDQDPEEEAVGSGRALTPVDKDTTIVPDGAVGDAPTKSDKQSDECTNHDAMGDEYQTLLHGLRQGSKSLANYYGAAKKLLRELGGRDITNSTAADFSVDDFRILNDVCAAFVRGLTDSELRGRLQKYASLSFDSTTFMTPNRSIYGVMAQIEGEKMIIAWESRPIPEKDDQSETLARSRIDQWKNLQNKASSGLDPLAYNKELQLANDAIKRIPSIGILLLEQSQYESASSYHSRAIRLMIDLGGHDLPSSQSRVLPVIVQQYSRGIYDTDIRAQVYDFLSSLSSPSLRAVARRHKSLQLAREFEKAVEKSMYPAETVGVIQKYVELLQAPLVPSMSGDMHFDFILPMTIDSWMLVAKIRDIPDPSRMSPNQPRDPYRDRLEFPKSGIGVQCDINFSAQLALQNTHLLRCYSLTDPRVRPIVLFVKHWAKVRGINTAYRGTLSSYGYVLMVIHYLVNVARPFVCPNLQLLAPPVPQDLTPEQIENTVQCKGRDVRFWRDSDQIADAAQRGVLNQNKDSIGLLLRGFFEYYAQSNMMSAGHMRGFDWGRDVISIRSHGGLVSKQQKGWTGAKTVIEVRGADKASASETAMAQTASGATGAQSNSPSNAVAQSLPSSDANIASKSSLERGKPEVKEVRHRFLFAIEDPFEWDHNVARTVTHNGIVAIRDEFRRAWRIIKSAGRDQQQEGLLQDVSLEKKADQSSSFLELLDEIHGKAPA